MYSCDPNGVKSIFGWICLYYFDIRIQKDMAFIVTHVCDSTQVGRHGIVNIVK